MKNEDRLNLFEDALNRLQAGEGLQSILITLPKDADLIDMVQTASLIKIPGQTALSGNPAAQAKSRQAFLQAAFELQSVPVKHGFLGWLQGLRLASQLTLIVFVLIFSLTVTGIVSAQALPGQALYGVKRLVEQTQLALTHDSLGRLQFEEVLDSRRIYEVLNLQDAGRWQDVSFAGWMHQNPDGSWQVQGIPVVLDEKSPMWNPMLNGAYVEVNGTLSPEGVIVRKVELRLFKMHGTLQLVDADNWQVNGITLKISPQTQTQLLISSGLVVDVTAIRLTENSYLALVINAAGPEETRFRSQSQSGISASPTPQPTDELINSQLFTDTIIPPEIQATEDLSITDDDGVNLENTTIVRTEEPTEESEVQQATPTHEESEESSHETSRTKTIEPDHD